MPASAPSCAECEALLRATIIKSIEDKAKSTGDVAQARAGEQIAQGHQKAAEQQAAENAAWQRWGPIGIVGAFVVGVTGAIIIEERRR